MPSMSVRKASFSAFTARAMYSGNSTADWAVLKNSPPLGARALHPDIEPLQLPELGTETNTVNPEIVIATDIHYLAKELTDFGSAFQEMDRNEDGKMASYVWEITDAFLNQVIDRRPQVLILSGDLTLNGERASQEALAQQLKRVEDAGIPVVVIPAITTLTMQRPAPL